jgi:multiple sugar transport system permease protein
MIRRLAFAITLCLLLVAVLFPLYWVAATSLKSVRDAFAIPPVLIFEPTFANYSRILNNGTFLRSFVNSFVVSLSASSIAVALGALTAYGLAQQESKTRRDIEKFVLSLRIAPTLLFVVPTYYLTARLGAQNSYAVLIGVYAFVNVPFAISMMISFFDDVPRELSDAARVDGAGEIRIFWDVVLPLARGGLIATFILCVLFTWNEFFIALVLSGRDTQTLPVKITSFLTFQGIEWGPLTAGATLIMLPMIVLGLIVQGNVVRGLTLGGVKG